MMKRILVGVALALVVMAAPSHAFLFGWGCGCCCNPCAPYNVTVSYEPVEPQPMECTYCTTLPYCCPDDTPQAACGPCGGSCCAPSCGTGCCLPFGNIFGCLFGGCGVGCGSCCTPCAPYNVTVSYEPVEPQPMECTYCTTLPYCCPTGAPQTCGCGPCCW